MPTVSDARDHVSSGRARRRVGGYVVDRLRPNTAHALTRGGCAVAALCLFALACHLPSESKRAGARSVVLVTIDTLRADALGVYGAAPSPSPHIDAFARSAAAFDRAAAPMPITRPTHASILTGRYPREHGVVNNATPLDPGRPTLARVLGEHGFATGAFVSVSLLAPRSGISSDFDVVDAPGSHLRDGAVAVDAALAWLDGLEDDVRFFMWVHLFEPHTPYAPPPAYRTDLDPTWSSAVPRFTMKRLDELARRYDGHLPRELLDHVRGLYRGDVAVADAHFGRLIEGIDARRDPGDVMVVLTADHGECFERGKYFDHYDCLHPGAIRVPLLVRDPAMAWAGSRVSEQVSSIDVPATVLRGLAIEPVEAFGGVALQSAIEPASAANERLVLVQAPISRGTIPAAYARNFGPLKSVAGDPVVPMDLRAVRVGVVGAGFALIRDGETESFRRVDVPHDASPTDSADAHPEAKRRLSAALDALLVSMPLQVEDAEPIDERLEEALRALGYLE